MSVFSTFPGFNQGDDKTKQWWELWWVWVIIVLVIIAGVGGYFYYK
jgi:hypothetical protein